MQHNILVLFLLPFGRLKAPCEMKERQQHDGAFMNESQFCLRIKAYMNGEKRHMCPQKQVATVQVFKQCTIEYAKKTPSLLMLHK